MIEDEMNNTSKYNYGKHIPLDDIPIDDLERALMDFSAGSLALSKCLREMWIHGLKTYSCDPGEKHTFDIGHIVMEEDEDIFCYLSESFLSDDKVRINIIDNRQEIKFAGSIPEKEGIMLSLTREIQNGKKNNTDLVTEKIGKPFPSSWIRRLITHTSNPDSTYWGEKVYIKKK